MSVKRLFLIILLISTGLYNRGICQDTPSLLTDNGNSQVKLNTQLKINRDALLKGSSEQIRIDAATVMMFSKDPLARKILLEVLKRSGSAATIAVCRALSETRTSQERLVRKNDFIKPLLGILATETGPVATLAAEATLIFEYEQISKSLEKLVADESVSEETRLNAVEALKLQPDMRAIFALMKLLDDQPQSPVAEAAEKALQELAIPVGKDPVTRKRIREELKRKGKNAFLRDWLIQKEDQMRDLKAENQMWQELYLEALTQVYENKKDDPGQGEFLAERLVDAEPAVRLWALERVYQGRVGTQSKLHEELGSILIGLISDQDRFVRLKTAEVLKLMGELNSAEQLLEQIEFEQDVEVKMELFVALGGACRYAFSPNSGIELPAEIRQKTLELAVDYLFDKDEKKAQNGADVIKKMLEKDGFTANEIDNYLGALVRRYNQLGGENRSVLRGGLLQSMAELSAQSSSCGAEAAVLFGPLFKGALSDPADRVREAAFDGLVNIDKIESLRVVKVELINDSSLAVRKKVVTLASEVGNDEDLVWMMEKMGSSVDDEFIWQGMLKIFENSTADVLNEWVGKFDSEGGLSDDRLIAFLDIAERKAVAEDKNEMAKDVTERLGLLYILTEQFELAGEHFGRLRELSDANDAAELDRIEGLLVDAYLGGGNFESAGSVVSRRLLENNLEIDSAVIKSIDNYVTKPSETVDIEGLLKELRGIEVPKSSAQMWAQVLFGWEIMVDPVVGER